MPDDPAQQAPSTFILATLRDPTLRLRHTVFCDILREEGGFRAVPRGIPLEGAGPTYEAALDNLRETLRTRFQDLRRRRDRLEGDDMTLYYLLHSLIVSRVDEDSAEIHDDVPIPDKLASFYGLKPGIVLTMTVCRGMFQATWGKSYLSAIGTGQEDALRNFCMLIKSLYDELVDLDKRVLQLNTWGFVRELMLNPKE